MDALPAMLRKQSILDTAESLRPHVRRSPLLKSFPLSDRMGRDVYLKLENLQRAGSFKIRGAINAIEAHRDTARSRGIITASAGNHAQGVALGARVVGCEVEVFMPETTPGNKVAAVEAYGAKVRLVGSTYEEAQRAAREHQQESGRLFIHPFDQEDVIQGQATLGVELTQQAPEPLQWVLVPVGGGGLMAGLCAWFAQRSPQTAMIPVQSADRSSLKQALEAGEPVDIDPPRTMAEGISAGRIGELPYEIMASRVREPLLVEEESIVRAILHLAENEKVVAEGAGAITVGALLGCADRIPEGTGAVLISGGNLDMLELSHVVERGLRLTGRLVRLTTQLPDRPGALSRLAGMIGDENGNIQAIHHDRSNRRLSVRSASVRLEVAVQDLEHRDRLLERLEQEGYEIALHELP